jgi:hypothetical protein
MNGLRDVYTRVFCVRFSVRDGSAAQLLPLRDQIRDRARKAKEVVGQWRHRGRKNGRKKRKCKRPFILFEKKGNRQFLKKWFSSRNLTSEQLIGLKENAPQIKFQID